MEIIVPGADYSALGLGNTRWVENYITNAGITNSAKKAALRTFYSGMVSNNLVSKFEVIRLLNTGSASSDRLNLLKPGDVAGNFRTTFLNDIAGAHTTAGYTFNQAASRYAVSEYTINNLAQLTNFHMHAFNKTPSSSGTFLMGSFLNGGGTSLFIGMGRNQVGLTRGGVTNHNSAVPLLTSSAGYDLTKTGLLSLSKVGTTQSLYDAGVQIATGTMAPAITIGVAPVPFYEGNAGLGFPAWISNDQVFMFAYGSPTVGLSSGEVAAFNTLVVALESAMAAA